MFAAVAYFVAASIAVGGGAPGAGPVSITYSLAISDLKGLVISAVRYRDAQFGLWEEVLVPGAGDWTTAALNHGAGTYMPTATVVLTNNKSYDYPLATFTVT